MFLVKNSTQWINVFIQVSTFVKIKYFFKCHCCFKICIIGWCERRIVFVKPSCNKKFIIRVGLERIIVRIEINFKAIFADQFAGGQVKNRVAFFKLYLFSSFIKDFLYKFMKAYFLCLARINSIFSLSALLIFFG